MASLVERLERLRGEFASTAVEAATALADVIDPASIDRHIEQVELDTTRRITLEQQARLDAQKALATVEAQLAEALELRDLATAALEDAAEQAAEAIARLEEVESRCREVEADAARRIAAVESDRSQRLRKAEATLRQMRAHIDSARMAQSRAEAERDAAHRRAERLESENASLRSRLDEQVQQHHHAIEARDIEFARAITAARAMADRSEREHREQISEMLEAIVSPSRRERGEASG
ncbi:hypothetical protein [Nocardia terpenica]|uniref:PspA/IM30 family protein n=1 Tax=Nocardia terpenica TaxID=455432 RepID=A0A161XB69_9NOCA|nr:hypothetical protein [Nocardia terpenica]KZM70398.1 hypothetical protein AWN90_03705 [Nocardia terpenica]NQE91079.1 hypothetical protein [Nocardia terpenica]